MDLNVDLWIWDLDADLSDQNHQRSVLSHDERTRADRFVHAIHTRRFVAGRARIRHILAQYLNSAPEKLAFDYGPNGKPTVPGPFAFNLSHTENMAALGVVAGAEIGVDIQKYRFVESDLARRFFAPAEIAELASLPQDRWQDGFYRCWTRKEAIVKAVGIGLSLDLASFDVSLTPNQPAVLRRFAPDPTAQNDWSLHHLDLAPDIVGAIAVKSRHRTVKIVRRQQ